MKNTRQKIMLQSATQKCEQYLIDEKQYNTDHEIWPSQNVIIEHLLNRPLEMASVYEELVGAFSERQCEIIINVVLASAAHWNPEAARKYRDEKNKLQEVNALIYKKATELSEALSKRDNLHNYSGFSSDTHYCICDVIDNASTANAHYTGFLREKLQLLQYQYDLKYWPSLSEIAQAIAVDANNSKTRATDSLTEAATASQRPSQSDYLKALLVHINTVHIENGLPRRVKISDNSLANIVNCSLNLEPNDLVDSSYVKGVRQRLREGHEK